MDQGSVARFIRESDIQLGILAKRGNASIKSMVKVYRLETLYNESIKTQEEAKSGATITKSTTNFDLAERLKCRGAVF